MKTKKYATVRPRDSKNASSSTRKSRRDSNPAKNNRTVESRLRQTGRQSSNIESQHQDDSLRRLQLARKNLVSLACVRTDLGLYDQYFDAKLASIHNRKRSDETDSNLEQLVTYLFESCLGLLLVTKEIVVEIQSYQMDETCRTELLSRPTASCKQRVWCQRVGFKTMHARLVSGSEVPHRQTLNESDQACCWFRPLTVLQPKPLAVEAISQVDLSSHAIEEENESWFLHLCTTSQVVVEELGTLPLVSRHLTDVLGMESEASLDCENLASSVSQKVAFCESLLIRGLVDLEQDDRVLVSFLALLKEHLWDVNVFLGGWQAATLAGCPAKQFLDSHFPAIDKRRGNSFKGDGRDGHSISLWHTSTSVSDGCDMTHSTYNYYLELNSDGLSESQQGIEKGTEESFDLEDEVDRAKIITLCRNAMGRKDDSS